MQGSSGPPPRRAAALVLLAGLFWGTTGTSQALGAPDAPPVVLGALRLVVAAAALWVWAVVRGTGDEVRGSGRRRPFLVPRSSSLVPVAAASLGVAAYQPLFFTALPRTGVGVGTVVAIGSAPLIAGFLGAALFRERPGRAWAVATALAVGGCALLYAPGAGADVDGVGLVLALGAGFGWALYAVSMRRAIETSAPETATAAAFTLAALLLSPALFAYDASFLEEPRAVVAVLHLGVVATALAYGLFSRGLTRITAATGVTLSLAEPLTAATLGIVVLGERPGPAALVGMLLIVAGLFVAARSATTFPKASG